MRGPMDSPRIEDEPKVLIVDDRPENLIAMQAALRDLGVSLITAPSGEAALSLMLRHRFAVVLLDVQMPGLDGFETAALMREHEDTKNIPIIFLTAFNKEDDNVFRGYESGAVDYLFKPVDPRILRSKVQVLLDLRRSHAELERALGELEQANACLDDFAFALSGLLATAPGLDAGSDIRGPLMLDPEEMIRRAHALLGQLSADCEERGAIRESGPEKTVRFLGTDYRIQGIRAPVLETLVTSLEDVARLGRHVVQAYARLQEEVEERKRAEEAARTANQARGRFLRHMSHEFRTPLNAILGFSELLRLGAGARGLDPTFRDGLDSIERAGSYLLGLVNEILDFAGLEAGTTRIDLEEVAIYEFVQEIHRMAVPLARKQENTLLLECDPDIGTMVTDRLKLHQILNNLLGNACKFTSNGEVRMHVSREEESRGQTVVFRVTDTGIGIEPHEQHLIFEEFRQAEHSRGRANAHGGAGLGLAISERYCRLLSGSIELRSEPGKGSVFTVRLPAEAEAGDARAVASGER